MKDSECAESFSSASFLLLVLIKSDDLRDFSHPQTCEFYRCWLCVFFLWLLTMTSVPDLHQPSDKLPSQAFLNNFKRSLPIALLPLFLSKLYGLSDCPVLPRPFSFGTWFKLLSFFRKLLHE